MLFGFRAGAVSERECFMENRFFFSHRLVCVLALVLLVCSPVFGESTSGAPTYMSLSEISRETGQISDKISSNASAIQLEQEESRGGKSKTIEVEVRVDLQNIPEAADGAVSSLAADIFNGNGVGGGDIYGVGGVSGTESAKSTDENSDGKTFDEALQNVTEYGNPYADVPELIKMKVDVGWSEKDATDTVKDTISKADAVLWNGYDGTGGGDTENALGVGGSNSYVGHADSLMDSAVKFTAEAFFGAGANEKSLGIGGGDTMGVGGGDTDETGGESSKIVNMYISGSDDYTLEFSKENDGVYLYMYFGGIKTLRGYPDGTFRLVNTDDVVTNMRWNIVSTDSQMQAAGVYELGVLSDPVYAEQTAEDYAAIGITSSPDVEDIEAVWDNGYVPANVPLCTTTDPNGAASLYACTYGSPITVDGVPIKSQWGITAHEADSAGGSTIYKYLFTPIEETVDGSFQAVPDAPSFWMTNYAPLLSEEDLNHCVDMSVSSITGNSSNNKIKLCLSSELNQDKGLFGQYDLSDEDMEKAQTLVDRMPSEIDVETVTPKYESGKIPIISYLNEALAKIVNNLYKPMDSVAAFAESVFNTVLGVSVSLIPLAIILTIAVSMRNGASSASGIADTRTFIIDLIVSLGLAVSSHYIIKQTTAIGTFIASKISNQSFSISDSILSGNGDLLQSILLLIVGVLFVFLLVAIVIEVFFAAMAMQAHYVMLCAFSPIMLVMSSYKPLRGLRDQWFKMVLHGMLIAPANAIVLYIMNSLK